MSSAQNALDRMYVLFISALVHFNFLDKRTIFVGQWMYCNWRMNKIRWRLKCKKFDAEETNQKKDGGTKTGSEFLGVSRDYFLGKCLADQLLLLCLCIWCMYSVFCSFRLIQAHIETRPIIVSKVLFIL